MYPITTTTTTTNTNNNNNNYNTGMNHQHGMTVWKLKENPLNPSQMSINKLGKPNRNSKRKKYFAKGSSKKKRKSLGSANNLNNNYTNKNITTTTTTTTTKKKNMMNIVDLTETPSNNNNYSKATTSTNKRKPPSAQYVTSNNKSISKQIQLPTSSIRKKNSQTRNAATPGGGFLLTPGGNKTSGNNNNNNSSSSYYNNKNNSMNYRQISPVPAPVFSSGSPNAVQSKNNNNNNNSKKVIRNNNIENNNNCESGNSQPRINLFFEKSDIKWGDDNSKNKRKQPKQKRSLLADAARGILRSGTSSGRNVHDLHSRSPSMSLSPSITSTIPLFFTNFVSGENNRFFSQYRKNKLGGGLARSLKGLSSTSHNRRRSLNNSNNNSRHSTASYQRESELKMPELISKFNIDKVVEQPRFIYPSMGTGKNKDVLLDVKPYAQNLSFEQKQAVTTPLKKPAIITAGPGSGKTRTLISRLCYLIDCGADPKSCLAFTFTRDATNEIKERTEHILGEVAANKITIKNFHSFALQILLRHGKEYDILGRGGSTSGGLTVIDEKEQYQYVANAVARIMEYEGFKKGNISSLIPKEAMDCGKGLSDDDDSGKANGLEEYLQRDLKLWDSDGWGATTISKNMRRVGFDYPLTGPGAPNPDHVTHFLKVIKLSKAQCKYPHNFYDKLHMTSQEGGNSSVSSSAAEANKITKKRNEMYYDVYSAYEELLDLNHKLDYSDFIPGLIHLFESAPALKEKYKQIYQFVFVDEFQDLNLPQIVLLQMLCEEGRITVCGDPDQSIYGFRGAYGSLGFTTFKHFWEEHHEKELKTNYRSEKEIVECSTRLIEHNVDEDGKKKTKDIYDCKSRSGNDETIGKRIKTFFSAASPRAECEKIASFIKLKRYERGCSYSKFAILARSLQVVSEVEKALVKHKIPVDGIHCSPTMINGKISYASNLKLLDSPTCYFFRRLGRLILNDIANDECLDILAPKSNVCPFQINKDTIDMMNFFSSNYELTYIMAARDIVELNDEMITERNRNNNDSNNNNNNDDDNKEKEENSSSSTTTLAKATITTVNGKEDGNLSDDEDKHEMKHKISLIDQEQIKYLKFFVEFVDKLRNDIKNMKPNDVLHAMIKGSKFHKSLKRKNVVDLKSYFDALSALDNHASEFTNSWEGMVNYPDRKGCDVFEKWLDELEMHISYASQQMHHGGGSGSNNSAKKKKKKRRGNNNNNIDEEKHENIIDAVTVTTIHRAKGREWPTVIIARMNEGVFPVDVKTRKHLGTVNSLVTDGANHTDYHLEKRNHVARHEEEDVGVIEEERRLAYVAITRASDELILSSIRHNGDEFTEPSRFIEECLSKNK